MIFFGKFLYNADFMTEKSYTHNIIVKKKKKEEKYLHTSNIFLYLLLNILKDVYPLYNPTKMRIRSS